MSDTKEFEKHYTEEEPTGKDGTILQWSVRVSEPDVSRGEQCAFIAIEEASVGHPEWGKDSMLLDIHAARWLLGTLYEAVKRAEEVERNVKKSA